MKRTNDRRVDKTQKLLREALGSLIHEKDYDSISVKEILDRANVGRSTFYMHFRDKDDLLASRIHEMLASVESAPASSTTKAYERLVWFSVPFLEYHRNQLHVGEKRMGARGRAILHRHLEKELTQMIVDECKKILPVRRKSPGQIPLQLLARYIASTFVLVLDWWTESKGSIRANEVDRLFRELVLPTLAANWDSLGDIAS